MPHYAPTVPLYILKHLVEREAQQLRAYLGFTAAEPVDAIEVAGLLGLDVKYPGELRQLAEETRAALEGEMRAQWSGMTVHLPDGVIVVVLNPTHSGRRRQATLMEEVAHVHLGHEASTIAIDPMTGLMRRSYDRRTETEATYLGGAVLVPKCGLRALAAQGYRVVDIAEHYGVSHELALFRINLCGLRQRAG